MAKEIPLTKGKVAIVDDDDYKTLNQHKWGYNGNSDKGYAVRTVRFGKRKTDNYVQKAIMMHREIMGANDSQEVDHINRNRLDNRRENLRLCDKYRQNMYNRGKTKSNSTGYKGVTKQYGPVRLDGGRASYYRARIMLNNKMISLGVYNTAEEAAHAYDIAALEYFKDFAYLNFKSQPSPVSF